MLEQGQVLPDISLPAIKAGKNHTASIRALTAGRKTVLFVVPGAFTPACSDEHLPGYVDRAPQFAEHGVEEIFCLAVNDAFVLANWAEAKGAQNTITFLADGNGEFTRAVGMTLDGTGFHLGERSKRYAAVIEDSRISQIHIEDGVGVSVSSASNLLKSL